MKIGKVVSIFLLAVLFLGMIMFALPTKSQSTAPYDPWADQNGDGQIDMYDIGYPASMFLATGDTTKDVRMTENWTQNTYVRVLNPNDSWLFETNTAGFRKVTVSVYATAIDTEEYDISIGFVLGSTYSTYQVDQFVEWTNLQHYLPSGFINCTTGSYDVTGSTIWVYILNKATDPAPLGTMNVNLSIFMTA